MVEWRQSHLGGYLAFYKQLKDKDVVVDKAMLKEALEYSLIEDVLSFGKSSEGIGSTDRGDGVFEVSTSLKNSINYPTFELTETNKFSTAFNKNRFFTLPIGSWDIMKVRLPKNTQMELIEEKDKKGIHIWKSYFFNISIEIRDPSFTMLSQGNSVPIGFRSDKSYSQKIHTENYNIFLRANFSRISSENPETIDDKEWVKSLFDFIEKRYSDLHNKENYRSL